MNLFSFRAVLNAVIATRGSKKIDKENAYRLKCVQEKMFALFMQRANVQCMVLAVL